jgi:hypothetical protein
MDLTKGFPRSPYEELGGIVFLPRAIDKMRAHIAGTKGEYNSHHGTSGRMFRLLFGVSADEFEQIVRANATDDGVLAALRRRAPVTAEQIEDWNEHALNDSPVTEAEWVEHWQRLEAAGHGHRREIVTRFDRLDLDEGRDVPVGGRHATVWLHRRRQLVDRMLARQSAQPG